MTRMYGGLVDNIATAVNAALSKIQAENNYEYGDELEIAFSKVLRSILPSRFGVCRGYVVNRAGETAGDDIIVYEKMNFPTARFLEEDPSSLERVPVEAVMAYIESKHTLEINGTSASSLAHATAQTAKVKALCLRRHPVPMTQITRQVSIGSGFEMPYPKGWPTRRDPVYTAVIARFVRLKPKGERVTSPESINAAFEEQHLPAENPPDLVIAGESNVMLPAELNAARTGGTIESPFTLPNCSLACFPAPNIAYGVGICHMLWALDFITLGAMPWSVVVGDGLGIAKP